MNILRPTTFGDDPGQGLPEPEVLQIIVTVNRFDDTINVSKCLDPQFDLDVLTEGLASLLIIAGKYTERSPERVLEDVHRKLENAVKFHGKMK